MPIGYLITDGKGNTVGYSGDTPRSSLMTKSQGETTPSNLNLRESYLKEMQGKYVGCRDCPLLTDSLILGCWEQGINTDNCRRTKEG